MRTSTRRELSYLQPYTTVSLEAVQEIFSVLDHRGICTKIAGVNSHWLYRTAPEFPVPRHL